MAKRTTPSPEQVETVEQSIGHGVGALLKASRLRVGLDLREISAVLRIRHVYLEAIEDGRFGELPGPTYATGFIRAYAEHLGLDSEEVVRRYKADASGEDGAMDNNLVFPEPIPEPGIPGGAVVFVGIVVAVVAYGVWYVNTSKDGFLAELISPVPERLAEAAAKGDSAKAAPEAAPETVSETVPETSQETSTPAEPEAAEQPADKPADAADTDQARESVTGNAPEEPQSQSEKESQETEAAQSMPVAETAPEPSAQSTPETAPEPAPETAAEPAPAPAPEATPETPADKPAEAIAEAAPETTPEVPAAPAAKRNPLLGLQVATVPEDRAAPVKAAAQPQPQPEPQPEPAAQPEPQPGPEPEPQTPSRDTVSTPPSASGSAPAPAPRPETASLAPAASEGGGKVTIRALTNSWIQIRDDIAGELLLTRLLRVGDSYAVPERKGLKLSTGNAGALEILVDGKAVPAIGGDGDVRRNVALDADKLKAGTAVGQ